METINEKGLQKIKGGAACKCMCSSGWEDQKNLGRRPGGGHCQCDGGSANHNANNNLAV